MSPDQATAIALYGLYGLAVWVATSVVVVGAWCGLCELVRWRHRRRLGRQFRGVVQRGRHRLTTVPTRQEQP